jgi:hypothetical protein
MLIARVGGAIAATNGEVQAVLRDALAALVEDHATIASTQRRRAKDRQRKHSADSKDSAEQAVGRGISDGSSPLPSSSFPEPHITPSFPPSPLPPRQPQGVTEQQVHDRAPLSWPVLLRFVAGKEDVAVQAWMGRFLGALDRPPHPTDLELRDAVEDLMTEPQEKWVPTLFRRYVERIRRDATRAAERAADGPQTIRVVNADSEALWAKAQAVASQCARGMLSADEYQQLPTRVRDGLKAIGGWTAIRDAKPADIPWRKRDFLKAAGVA